MWAIKYKKSQCEMLNNPVKFEPFSCLGNSEKLEELFVQDPVDYSYEKLKIDTRSEVVRVQFSDALKKKLEDPSSQLSETLERSFEVLSESSEQNTEVLDPESKADEGSVSNEAP